MIVCTDDFVFSVSPSSGRWLQTDGTDLLINIFHNPLSNLVQFKLYTFISVIFLQHDVVKVLNLAFSTGQSTEVVDVAQFTGLSTLTHQA